MTKRRRPAAVEADDKTPIRKEFGHRLRRAMDAKDMNQSDLARAINVQRMAISLYVNGKSLPTRARLQKLADALSVDPRDLLPSRTNEFYSAENLAIEVRVLPENPNRALLRINKTVKTSLAFEIAGKLSSEEVTE